MKVYCIKCVESAKHPLKEMWEYSKVKNKYQCTTCGIRVRVIVEGDWD